MVPRPIETSAGVIARDWSTAGKTVNNAEFEMIAPDVAVILAEPVPLPVANPAASIVATVGNEETQLTVPVTF